MPFPKYQCHKTVRAFKIAKIEVLEDPREIVFHDASGEHAISVDDEFVQRNNPQSGGYFVKYGDGYASYSPQIPFENGYTLVPEDFHKRMIVENMELQKKLIALNDFIDNNPIFGGLPKNQRKLMHKQSEAMQTYSDILMQRINEHG